MKIFITGATGFIGQEIVKKLSQDGHNKIICYTRDQMKAYNKLGDHIVAINEAEFDICAKKYLENCDAVINLAGEPVFQRWTERAKEKIIDSRLDTTEKLVKKINSCEKKPEVLISASAIGYYGNAYDNTLTESSEDGEGFLPDICDDWEWEARKANTRLINLRIGIVLGKEGGALKQMLLPFKLGLGGRLGSGHQWMSWIHINDVVNIIFECIKNKKLSGPVNCVSPNPVKNRKFTKTLSKALSRPAVLPVPEFGLKLLFGESSSVLLDSQRCIPKALLDNNFKFEFSTLEEALKDILN